MKGRRKTRITLLFNTVPTSPYRRLLASIIPDNPSEWGSAAAADQDRCQCVFAAVTPAIILPFFHEAPSVNLRLDLVVKFL